MSTAPFDVAPIAARLRAQVPALRQVGLSADYAAIKGLPDFPAPCAFVILATEKGLTHPPGHAPRGQQVTVRQVASVNFAVVLAVRNYREQRGEQVNDDLQTILASIRGTLMGFVPDVDGGRPCEFVRGDLQDYNAGVALWADVYATQHSIGKQVTP